MLIPHNFPYLEFLKKLYERVFDADIFNRAAQVAFYFSFSLFPLLFFLLSVLGLILESAENLRSQIFVYLGEIMPNLAFVLVKTTLEEIVESSSGGKLTLGLLITLWSASAGVDSVRSALNAVYGLKESRQWWKLKLQSLLLTLLLIAVVCLVIMSIFYGWKLVGMGLDNVGLQVTSPWVLVLIQWVGILIVIYLACEGLFNWLPDYPKFRWIRNTPGTLVAIVLWIFLTRGFKLYLVYFNSYNRTYGSLGAVIILMLWLYLTAIALLFGGVINAVLGEIFAEMKVSEAVGTAIETEDADNSKTQTLHE